MMATKNRLLGFILSGTVFCSGSTTLLKAAADNFAPVELQIETGRDQDGQLRLAGLQSRQQLLLTGRDAAGSLRDLTRGARFEVAPDGIVRPERWLSKTPIAVRR
jgi:hypothetical protein